MKLYITKYCFSIGILFREAELPNHKFVGDSNYYHFKELSFIHKDYCHKTKEEAIAHTEILKEKKIKSFLKQIDKLKSMEFNLEDEK